MSGSEVEAITVTGNERMIERHNVLEPADLMLAQYSVPFCVALALHREARDSESFDEMARRDPQIRALCRRVRLVPEPGTAHGGMGSMVTITLADKRRFESRAENGMLEPCELEDKFLRLTRGALGEPRSECALRAPAEAQGREGSQLARSSASVGRKKRGAFRRICAHRDSVISDGYCPSGM